MKNVWRRVEVQGDLLLAELDLVEGDMLKWLYDFGDNYEYTLQLEATADPSPDSLSAPDADEYPRIAGANEPELLYCNECQAKGKQVVAKWHCWVCSDRHNTLYMLCDDCSGKRKHEEHYQVEWVY